MCRGRLSHRSAIFSSNVSDKRFLFKPVNEMLQKRRAMADAEIQDATKAKEEALAMKTEYEQNMQQAKAKASDIVTEAQRQLPPE